MIGYIGLLYPGKLNRNNCKIIDNPMDFLKLCLRPKGQSDPQTNIKINMCEKKISITIFYAILQ